MVLVMTVEPGFGGQKFLDLCLPKIRRARALLDQHGIETWLQVDGGVSLETIERCAEAGADVFVAGSAVYAADDPDQMVAQLRADRGGRRPRSCRPAVPDLTPHGSRPDVAGLSPARANRARVLWGRCNSEPAVTDRTLPRFAQKSATRSQPVTG